MNDKFIAKQKDAQGRTRFYVLPIETEAGFLDLVKFVSQEFECEFAKLDKGPGTLVQKGVITSKTLVFVLSDSTGAQFFAEDESDIGVAERVSESVKARFRAIGTSRGQAQGQVGSGLYIAH